MHLHLLSHQCATFEGNNFGACSTISTISFAHATPRVSGSENQGTSASPSLCFHTAVVCLDTAPAQWFRYTWIIVPSYSLAFKNCLVKTFRSTSFSRSVDTFHLSCIIRIFSIDRSLVLVPLLAHILLSSSFREY